MAFSGYDENVGTAKFGDCRRDGFAAIADLDSARRRREDRAANLLGLLAARIVVRDIDEVGELARDLAHLRALAAVAVAAGAEHDREPSFDMRPQRGEDRGERIRGVSVIDKDGRAGRGLAHSLHAAGHPGRPRKAAEGGFGWRAGCDDEA